MTKTLQYQIIGRALELIADPAQLVYRGLGAHQRWTSLWLEQSCRRSFLCLWRPPASSL
jgi:hypothetical protein